MTLRFVNTIAWSQLSICSSMPDVMQKRLLVNTYRLYRIMICIEVSTSVISIEVRFKISHEIEFVHLGGRH
jgi:hypothetical protein